MKLDYGVLSEEEKALPSNYKPDESKFVPIETHPSTTEYTDNMVGITTIPQHVLNNEPQCEWIFHGSTKGKVLNALGYPAPIPKPSRPDLYEVKSTSDMGMGLFAKRDIKCGDLILGERPLLVSPRLIVSLSPNVGYTDRQLKQVVIFEYERLLEYAIGRLPNESQADFRALLNAHTGDGSGPLLRIVRTNGYSINNLYDGLDKTAVYGAICKIGSHINHSCKPNVKDYFKINSFSIQFYALRDIKAGEQLFYSYCNVENNVADRQAELAPYSFVCKCPACLNATAETDQLRTTFETQISGIVKSLDYSPVALEEAVRLEKAMVKEGLDVEPPFMDLVTAICFAYMKLGKQEESEKYHLRMEALQKCFIRDE